MPKDHTAHPFQNDQSHPCMNEPTPFNHKIIIIGKTKLFVTVVTASNLLSAGEPLESYTFIVEPYTLHGHTGGHIIIMMPLSPSNNVSSIPPPIQAGPPTQNSMMPRDL